MAKHRIVQTWLGAVLAAAAVLLVGVSVLPAAFAARTDRVSTATPGELIDAGAFQLRVDRLRSFRDAEGVARLVAEVRVTNRHKESVSLELVPITLDLGDRPPMEMEARLGDGVGSSSDVQVRKLSPGLVDRTAVVVPTDDDLARNPLPPEVTVVVARTARGDRSVTGIVPTWQPDGRTVRVRLPVLTG